jgi:YD repeat-containing protein
MEAFKTRRNNILKLLVLLISSAKIQTAQAQVNLLEGSYRRTETDVISKLQLLRSYSSRSTRTGLFGFGWCSNLEDHLKVRGDAVELYRCPHRRPLVFKRGKIHAPVQRFLSMIRPSAAVYPLEEQVYESNGARNGNLRKQPTGWVWTQPDGAWSRFGTDGLLLEQSFIDGRTLVYDYDSRKKLHGLSLAGGLPLRIDLSPETGLITGLSFSGDERLAFRYQGRNLISVSGTGEEVLYKYDPLDNLIEIVDAGGVVKIRYDEEDRVTELRSDCRDRFVYRSPRIPLELSVKQVQSCPARPRKIRHHRFQFHRDLSEEIYLTTAEITEGNQKLVKSYDLDGRLLERRWSTPAGDLSFDPDNRLVQILLANRTSLRLVYTGESDKPSLISSSLPRGFIKLDWHGASPRISELSPRQNAAELKSLLEKALLTLNSSSSLLRKDLSQ